MTDTDFSIDRSSNLRKDQAAVDALWMRDDARVLVLVDGKPVITSNAERSNTRVRWFGTRELRGIATDAGRVFLGLDARSRVGLFAVSILAAEPSEQWKPAVDFRSLVTQGTMPNGNLALVATALSLTHWQSRTRYCGSCGAATTLVDAGWKRVCACGAESFPRVDPVVIMLVTDGVRCLLAREPHFPPGLYSTLAGFVEPGESLEEAVKRETNEEVGLAVTGVRLVADQPWPMPHSLMLGCVADVAPGRALQIDSHEIEDAAWASREDIRALLDGPDTDGRHIPPRQAIANVLFRAWANEA